MQKAYLASQHCICAHLTSLWMWLRTPPHPSYLLDLALWPSDFIFLKLKTELLRKHFANEDEIIGAVEAFLEEQE